MRYFDIPMVDVLPTLDDLSNWEEAGFIASQYLRMVTEGAPSVARAFGALAGAGRAARRLPLQRGQGPHACSRPSCWRFSACPTR